MQRQLIKGLGWRRDHPDHRDHKFGLAKSSVSLPPSVNLRGGFGPIYDQLALGSCTANAIAAALQFERRKQGLSDFIPARLWIYFWERMMEGTVDSDSGAEIRDGLQVVANYGTPPETDWPYDISTFKNDPPAACYMDSLKDRVLQYQRLDNTDPNQLKTCLANGNPFVFGISVFQSFMDSSNGDIPLPSGFDRPLGGHALCAAGYEDTDYVNFRNSWGPRWGDQGYGRIPMSYLTNPELSADFWTIQLISKGE